MGKLPKIEKDADDLRKPPRRRSWRGALASLAATVGASFALKSTVPAATPPSTQGPPAVAQEVRRSKGTPNLILRSGTQITHLAQHESHESHSSHESHYSGQ